MDEITCETISGLDLYFQWKILYFLLMVQVWEEIWKPTAYSESITQVLISQPELPNPCVHALRVGNKCVKGA